HGRQRRADDHRAARRESATQANPGHCRYCERRRPQELTQRVSSSIASARRPGHMTAAEYADVNMRDRLARVATGAGDQAVAGLLDSLVARDCLGDVEVLGPQGVVVAGDRRVARLPAALRRVHSPPPATLSSADGAPGPLARAAGGAS